jgi:hypothetical protein
MYFIDFGVGQRRKKTAGINLKNGGCAWIFLKRKLGISGVLWPRPYLETVFDRLLCRESSDESRKSLFHISPKEKSDL